MKRTISLFLSLILVMGIVTSVPITVNAASVDDLTFELNDDGTGYVVTDCNNEASGELVIPDTYNGLPITEIGFDVFNGNESLTSVIMPDTIKAIKASAFQDCTSLTTVHISETVEIIEYQAFADCENLVDVNFPDSLKEIDYCAFGWCEKLENVYLPDGMTFVDGSCFSNTAFSNNEDNRENGLLYLNNYLLDAENELEGEVVVKAGTKHIAKNAFMFCDIASVELPDGLLIIDSGAFEYCHELETINIPDTVNYIGAGAFEECFKLEAINIPNSVIEIGNRAFHSCNGLKEVTLGDCVTKIGEEAFMHCSSLESIVIPDSVVEIGQHCFYDCGSLKTVVLSTNISEIPDGLFCACDSLQNINLPEGITRIGEGSFNGCLALQSVYIPSTVTAISDSSFIYCDGIEYFEVNDANEDYKTIDGVLYSCYDSYDELGVWFYPAKKAGQFYIGKDVFIANSAAFEDNRCNVEAFSVASNHDRYVTKDGVLYNTKADRLIVYPGGKKETSYTIDANMISVSIDYCPYLEEIVVSQDNPYFASSDGVLFYKDMSVMYRYPDGKKGNYTIPESVTEVEYGAFRDCTGLEILTLYRDCLSESNENIKSIKIAEDIPSGRYFDLSSNIYIEELIFPAGVELSSYSKFYWCDNLKTIRINQNAMENFDNFFGDCESVETIEFLEDVTYISDWLITYSDSLKTVAMSDNVTEIGEGSFTGCKLLENVTLSNNLLKIGYDAFAGCGIETILLPDRLELIDDGAFSGTKIKTIVIPDKVKSIGSWAFDASGIEEISLNEGLESIGNGAFYNCNHLKSIVIPDTVVYLGESVFAYSDIENVTLSDNIKNIEKDSFSWCQKLESVVLPKKIEGISEYAFYSCSSLKTINLPRTLTHIGKAAFYGCSALKSLVIPDSVENLDVDAFDGCENLTSVTVNYQLAERWWNYFDSPDVITHITISGDMENELNASSFWFNYLESVSVVGENDYYTSDDGVLFNKDKSTLIYYPENKKDISYTVPSTVKTIGERAFAYCKNIENVTIPSSVESILYSAFAGCDALTKVTINEGLKSIGVYAFESCYNLIEITLPSSVSKIDYAAFYGCEALKTINLSNNVNTIGSSAFYNTAFYNDKNNWKEDILYAGVYLLDSSESLSGKIKISDSTIVIADSAFSGCNKLTEVAIPNSVRSVGDYAFDCCTNLEFVTVPESVKNIGEYAFIQCVKLKSVSIPDSVTSIGKFAFGYYYEGDVIKKISGFTIQGKTGSVAEKYAKENGFEFVNVNHTHTLSDWITDSSATVYKAGSKHKECTECGETLETATIPQLKCSAPVLKKVYNANSYVKVTWGTVKGADKYYVYRKTGTGDYEYIGSTTNTYFNDKEAGAGKTCRYRIRAKNEAGNSVASNSLAIKHIDEPTLKSIENSSYGVLIKWDKVTGAEKYNVYRKVSGGEYKYIGATSNTYYTDKTAKSGTKYYYAIRGKRDDSVSSQSASLSKYYLADPTLNTPSTTTKGVGLRWSKVVGAQGYMVYRRTASGSYKRITTEKGVSNVTFRDTTAKKGTKYYYKVKAYKSKTYSAYSNTKTITDKY